MSKHRKNIESEKDRKEQLRKNRKAIEMLTQGEQTGNLKGWIKFSLSNLLDAVKPKQIGVDTPSLYGKSLQGHEFKIKDKAIYMGTVKESNGKAAHKDPVQIVGLDKIRLGSKEIVVTAKNLRTEKYFRADARLFMKVVPFSLNEIAKKIKMSNKEKSMYSFMKNPNFESLSIDEIKNYLTNLEAEDFEFGLEKDKNFKKSKKLKQAILELLKEMEENAPFIASEYESMLNKEDEDIRRLIRQNFPEFIINFGIRNRNDLNEMFDTLNLKPNKWVHVRGKGKRYIDQVDYNGANPDNPFKSLAVLIKIKPAAKENGQWVPWNELEYQYPEMEDDVVKDKKELTNMVKEMKKEKSNRKVPMFDFKKDLAKSKYLSDKPLRKRKDVVMDPTDFKIDRGKKKHPLDVSEDDTNKLSNAIPKTFSQNQKNDEVWKEIAEELTNNLDDEDVPYTAEDAKEILAKAHIVGETSDMIEIETPERWVFGIPSEFKNYVGRKLSEAKITGSLKKWSDSAKKIAKEIFKDKTWNKLSDREQGKAFEESENRKKKKRLEGPLKMKNSGDIDYEDEEN